MATEYKRIVLRKGVFSSLPTDLLPGELAFTTDTKQLFVGTDTGNKEIPVENIIMSDITDVDLTNLANGDVLKYSTTSGNWENEVEQYVNSLQITTVDGAKILTIGLNGGTSLSATLTNVLPLDALAGVVITEGAQNDVLQHNGQEWVDAPLNMEQLGNVSVSNITNGEILKWNATAMQWENDGDTDTQIKVDTFGFETNTYNLQLQQTAGGDDFSVDFAPVLVKNFELNTAAPAYQIDLTLQDDTVLTADLLGLRNSDVNSLTFNTSNDGVLTIGTVGGTTYTADLDGRYLTGTHSHGKINGDGQIPPGTTGIDVDIETGDKLLIINSGASSTITTADILFDTTETGKYLSQAGEFTTPTFDTSGLATSDHKHGVIENDGAIDGLGTPIGLNDRLVITKDSFENKLAKTTIYFDASQSTKYLSQDGTFSVPSFAPGNYVETTIDTLDSSNTTELVSSFSSYDKVIAVLYPSFTGAASTTTNGDTVPIYVSDQLNFVQTNAGSVCLDGNGDPILGPTTEQQCTTAGGTWSTQYINNYGRVNFEPGGSIERINSTQVRFNLPSSVTGVEWKLKLIGVTF